MIGLVLSGGGARGLAHLGLLKALEELGVKPKVISGVSAGALIGALYSAGYTPDQILQLAKEETSFNIMNILLLPGGLFSTSGMRKAIKNAIPIDDFNCLHIPLYVTATDVLNGTSVTFSSGPLHDVLVGSASVPAIFDPVQHDKHYLVDGGVLNNFPVECIRDQCHEVIGCHVNKLYNGNSEHLNKLYVIEKCFHLAIANTVVTKSHLCDVFIEPELAGYNMFDMKHAELIFESGYHAAMEQKEAIIALSNGQVTIDDSQLPGE